MDRSVVGDGGGGRRQSRAGAGQRRRHAAVAAGVTDQDGDRPGRCLRRVHRVLPASLPAGDMGCARRQVSWLTAWAPKSPSRRIPVAVDLAQAAYSCGHSRRVSLRSLFTVTTRHRPCLCSGPDRPWQLYGGEFAICSWP